MPTEEKTEVESNPTRTRKTKGSDLLVIQHEGVEKYGSCTKAAFERLWKHKGWTVVEDDDAHAVLSDAGNAPDADIAAARGNSGPDQNAAATEQETTNTGTGTPKVTGNRPKPGDTP